MRQTGNIRRAVHRLVGRSGHVPSAEQLAANALRHLAGAALVVLAAAIVHRTGHQDQQWQYVAVAAALIPQALLDALASGDTDRRHRLRTSTRPSVVPLVAAVALAVGSLSMLVSGGSLAVAAAAVCAASGLGIAAAPVTITIAPRSAHRARG